MADKKDAHRSVVREYASSFVIAVGLALVIRTGVVQAFYIPSGSMEDTLLVGDYLLANKYVYGVPIDVPFTEVSLFRLPALRDPRPGDIVIFRSPTEPGRDLIKRCVAVGGQEVRVVDKVLYVDGQQMAEPPQAKHTDRNTYPGAVNPRDNFGPYVVPADSYFMMGDNRDNSADSRYFRAVPRRLVKGKAMSIYWSWADQTRGPYYTGIASLPRVVTAFCWRLPGRIRFSRMGDVIT
jgi:signal peptidase I